MYKLFIVFVFSLLLVGCDKNYTVSDFKLVCLGGVEYYFTRVFRQSSLSVVFDSDRMVVQCEHGKKQYETLKYKTITLNNIIYYHMDGFEYEFLAVAYGMDGKPWVAQ